MTHLRLVIALCPQRNIFSLTITRDVTAIQSNSTKPPLRHPWSDCLLLTVYLTFYDFHHYFDGQ